MYASPGPLVSKGLKANGLTGSRFKRRGLAPSDVNAARGLGASTCQSKHGDLQKAMPWASQYSDFFETTWYR